MVLEHLLDHLKEVAAILGYFSAIATAIVLLFKPLRDKVIGWKYIASGVKCLLRTDMLRIYYENRESNTIRQYERENLEAAYKAYKALNGNSFMDDIHKEVSKWEVLD